MKGDYEVIIIGAGPGGLAAAFELAKHNKEVLLLEKNQGIGPKICAGGLTSKVSQLGISLNITDHEFSTVKAYSNNKVYNITLPRPFIVTVDREKFGQFLLKKAATAGAEVQTSAPVTKITPDYVIVNNQKIYYKYLIGADGSLSITRRYLGLKTKRIATSFQYIVKQGYPNLVISLDSRHYGSGYAWIFPHQGYTSCGIFSHHSDSKDRDLKKICHKWCLTNNIDLSNAKPEAWAINYDYCGWKFGNIFLIGDAGGFTSGLTGEGIYYAMISGQEAAKKIINSDYACPEIKRILKKKSIQEKLLQFMQTGVVPLNIYYRLLLSLSKNKWTTKKIVDFFS
ncbi:NAD(P)/FAD-dependent oxidoreductase [Patescibacteria group bacterium]|nr:NAD(P)/FAD-dependent oxidoreductase [Patescibacteria group bacterium]MBU0964665.1 NAD(P)/FAD-dependent oxidoreductase [Patescibacteria group bacterium]